MGLTVVATPIGDLTEISKGAIQAISGCEILIGEERTVADRLVKRLGLPQRPIEELNEHSQPSDVDYLVELCAQHEVALVSDCGTPGFCDPGADLVRACRKRDISVRSVPGPSSLSAFLSLCGQRLDRFYFAGFLSAEREQRIKELKNVLGCQESVILMDTPYRLERLVQDIAQAAPRRSLVLGVNLGRDQEAVYEGQASELVAKVKGQKAEFVLLIVAESSRNSVIRSRNISKKKYRPK